MMALLLGYTVQHQGEITVICTIIGGLAGLVSLYRGLRGK